MKALLILSIGLLSFANGANDNFKGVATLWGPGLATYHRVIAWATGFTILGSLAAISLGSGLAAKFNGATLLPRTISSQLPFLSAAALGAGATVILAAGLGLPISTTHSLTGALVGAGVGAAGFSHLMVADWGPAGLCETVRRPAESDGDRQTSGRAGSATQNGRACQQWLDQ